MATLDTARFSPALNRQRFSSIVIADDRAKAFRDAKRHSMMVRVLKIAFPVIAAVTTGLYFVPSSLTIDTPAGQASVEAVAVSGGDLKMVNPRIKGQTKTQGQYDFRADSAIQSLSTQDQIRLENIDGDLKSANGEITKLTAPGGIYDSKKEEMTFDQGANIERSTGLRAVLKSATVHFPKNLVISREPVEVRLHDSLIRAQSVEIFTEEARAVFTGQVYVHLERQPQSESPPKGEDGAGQAPQ